MAGDGGDVTLDKRYRDSRGSGLRPRIVDKRSCEQGSSAVSRVYPS